MSAPKQVYEIFIRTTPERLWQALTDGEVTKQYYHGTAVRSDLEVGKSFNYVDAEEQTVLAGDVLEIDPPRRLVTTFNALWSPDTAADPPSRVTYEIEPMGATCKLTMVHDGFESETATYRRVAGGWSFILSGLKTLLETGEPLTVGEPAGATA